MVDRHGVSVPRDGRLGTSAGWTLAPDRSVGAPAGAFDKDAHLMQHADQGGEDLVFVGGQATMGPGRAT
jgi:hypothetical protein